MPAMGPLFFLLLTAALSSGASLSGAEISDDAVSRTESAEKAGISQSANVTAVEGNAAREAKSLLSFAPANLGLEATTTRKVDSHRGSNNNTDSIYRLVVTGKGVENSTNPNKPANAAYKEMLIGRQKGSHRKYHYATFQNSRIEEKRKFYAPREDYEQATPVYNLDYYPPPQNVEYEETYNTIPEDQHQSQITIVDPLRVSYLPPDPANYVAPAPVTEISTEQDHEPQVIAVHECNCPPSATRSHECEHPSSSFLPLMSSLGKNLWALMKLMAASAAPFVIPLLAIKMILVPLKIIKLIKLTKLFVKIFIILPFFLRFVYPALSSSFSLDSLFQKIQDLVPSHNHHHHQHEQHQHVHPHDADRRRDVSVNSTFGREDYVEDGNAWDLRACPSRVSCEFGAFLASSTYDNFPDNLANFLARKADEVTGRSADNSGQDEEEGEGNTAVSRMKRNAAFKAFVIALGKRWSQEECGIYKCWALF